MNLPAAPAWTLKGKKFNIDKLNDGYTDSSPGPVYNMSGIGAKTKTLNIPLTSAKRSQINYGVLNNPGPGHYKFHTIQSAKCTVTFAKNEKPYEQINRNPDPFAYEANVQKVKQAYPNYTIGWKYPSIMDNTGDNPGPGHYLNPQNKIDSRASSKSKSKSQSKFGTQNRFSEPNIKFPGPGQYNITSDSTFLNGKGRLSKSRRSVQLKKTDPGPGQYIQYDQFRYNYEKNKGKSFGRKFKSSFGQKTQTQNAYNNYYRDDMQNKQKSFSIGKQAREVFKSNTLPGPSDYKPKTQHIYKDSARIKFAKSLALQKNQAIQNPGPGYYEQKLTNPTRYSIAKSKSIDILNKNPGVGRYNTDTGMGTVTQKFKNQINGNMIGKSQRINFVSKNIAGVGDYNIVAKKTTGVTIPKSQRFGRVNRNPGPSDYYLSSTISNFNLYRKK